MYNPVESEITMLGDMTVQPGSELGPRTINDYEIVFFPCGSNTIYTAAGVAMTLTEPCYILTRPGVVHQYEFDHVNPTRHLFVHFLPSETFITEHPCLSLFQEVDRLPATENLIPSLFNKMLQLADRMSGNWKTLCRSYLEVILYELAQVNSNLELKPSLSGNMPSPIALSIQYIDSHLHETVTIAGIAQHIGWSHAHFTRTFIKSMGITPQQIVLSRRINRARQYLVYEQWSIKQIAYAVGFKDEHHFSRCFKKETGLMATQYRQKYAAWHVPLYANPVRNDNERLGNVLFT